MIVCDIDGTVADSRHRLPAGGQRPKTTADWLAFLNPAAILRDPPVARTWRTVAGLAKPVAFITGRPERVRDETHWWLEACCDKYDVELGPLFMRADADLRKSHKVKQDALQRLRRLGFSPTIAFDDNPLDIQMYRAEGLKVNLVPASWLDKETT